MDRCWYGLLVCGFMACILSSCEKDHEIEPNIFFAIADEWSWVHNSHSGYLEVGTPAFDRMPLRVSTSNGHIAVPPLAHRPEQQS